MAYASCYWSILALPVFLALRMRIKRRLSKGLLKRVMKKYLHLLDQLLVVVSLQIVARVTAYTLVLNNDFFFNALYLRATLQVMSQIFLVIIVRTILFKTAYLDSNEEGEDLLGDPSSNWQQDFRKNIPLDQLEKESAL